MMIDRTYTRESPLLTIEGLNLSLGEGKDRKLILSDVNAQVRNIVRPGRKQGQVVGFLGPSGIGKTQLFKQIAGFSRPDSGSVRVGPEQELARPGLVGVVEQHYVVFEHMTTIENLVFAGMKGGLKRKDATEQGLAYLEKFDLIGQRDNWPGRLSGGQRQRLAILQQIMVGHSTICMDEPFSGLDVNQVHKVARLIAEVTGNNELLTIIVVTHDIGAAIEVSDTLWLMGHEPDAEKPGEFLPGARILSQADLIEEGLAWDPDIRQNPDFLKFEAYVAGVFKTLTRVA
jgi:ABC-type nitrate/sulfonate/bicarbonate transport system ATPase subunit